MGRHVNAHEFLVVRHCFGVLHALQMTSNVWPDSAPVHWHMQTVFEKMRSGKDSVALLSGQLGRQTEMSFSKAFRQQMGIGPGAARRGQLHNDTNTRQVVRMRHP